MNISETNVYEVEITRTVRESVEVRIPKSITDILIIQRMIKDAIDEDILSDMDFSAYDEWLDEDSVEVTQVNDSYLNTPEFARQKILTLNGSVKDYETYNNISVCGGNIQFDKDGNQT